MDVPLHERARADYGVPALDSYDAVITWLESLGATHLALHKHWEGHYDEFVHPKRVSDILTIADEEFIRTHASQEEHENILNDAPDDPSEYQRPADEPEDLWLMDFEIGAKRLLILLERHPRNPDKLGNYRIYGAGQWLREALWAATGVLPLDPGSEEGELFRQTFEQSIGPLRRLWDALTGSIIEFWLHLRGWDRI
ncbi:hypothetical protein [Bifidobacterium sp.]|uniref:hypothetical protein n=1 Tax=Bifidobacterium sp. TaxID=41200 RepID=UPI0039EBD40D